MDTTRPSLLMRVRDRSDIDAWRTFDAIYRPMLHRFARAAGLNDDAADDIVQTCLAAVSKQIRDFVYDPRKGQFKGWLRTLVNRRVIDSQRRRRECQGDTHELRDLELEQPLPEEVFEQLWMEEHLGHCLRELRDEVGETTFKAFQYFVMQQRPIGEVAAELNLAPNNIHTIKWRFTQRVAARMRELLGEIE